MASQGILWTPAGPAFVNETDANQGILGGVFLNETQVATSLTPGAGSAVVTGFAPTVAVGTSLIPGAGSVVVTGFAPTVAAGNSLAPSAGSVAVIGFAPIVTAGNSLTPGAGSVVVAGQTPVVAFGISLVPAAGSVVLTGAAPDAAPGIALTPDAGAIAVTGFAPDVAEGDLVTPDAGSLAITGYVPDIVAGTAAHVVVGGAGGGRQYVRPQPLPTIVGAGESEQPLQVASGLGAVGAGVEAAQMAQAASGTGALGMRQREAASSQQPRSKATAWLDGRRGLGRSFQGGGATAADGVLTMAASVRSGAVFVRLPDYEADVMTFEDDDFMSDLELEDA